MNNRNKINIILIRSNDALKTTGANLNLLPIKLFVVLFLILLTKDQGICQTVAEIKPDGIVVPSMTTRPSTASSSFAQIIYNTTFNQYEFFNGSSWIRLQRQDELEDADGDTRVELAEFGGGFPDQIEFYINNSMPMILQESPSGSTRLFLDDGQNNVLVGELAGNSIGTGNGNTYIGDGAGKITFSGSDNVVLGKDAGQNIRDGNHNVAIGRNAGFSMDNGENNIIIGKDAGRSANANNVYIGHEAGKANPLGANTFVGFEAGLDNTGANNTFIGYKSGVGQTQISSGNNNVAIGPNAGRVITTGSTNTFVGVMAGENVGIGNSNVAIGYDAGQETSGSNNTSIGYGAGRKADSNNVFIGRFSGSNVTGSNNVFLGSDSGVYQNESNLFYIGSGINGRLATGEFDNKTMTVYGDLQIHPKDILVSRNSHLRMMDSNGNMDEIIRRSGTDNSVVMGDVENNGGDLHLRSSGTTSFSVLADGTAKFWPMSNPPGTCGTSFRGRVYFDDEDNKLRTCGKKLGAWGWWDMY